MTSLPILNMYKQAQSYEPVGVDDSHAELTAWRENPMESVESRNKQISLHRRPGFYKKGLLGSIAANAILLMVCGWLYMKLAMSVFSSPAFSHPQSCLLHILVDMGMVG